jgi:hypothetical protein
VDAVVSMSEAGRMLGIGRKAVGEWLASLGMQPQDHPSNSMAKGVTLTQVATLREAIEAGRRVVAQSA